MTAAPSTLPSTGWLRKLARVIALPLLVVATLAAFSGPAVAQETRESGLTVTVQELDGVTIHSLTAPEEMFANSTYLIETENALVGVDTQFLLPFAADMRAYADELGKPIDRLYITHEHPDHFLGSEAFADVPVHALQEVADSIAANGQAEVDEKQADFGDAIASTFVVPEVVAPSTIDIDGVEFVLEKVLDAEAEFQLVIKLPAQGAIVTGDITYSGVHLIMAGQPQTWIPALESLATTADDFPVVLPGHGMPTDPSVYDANIAWLNKASELIGTVDTADDFRQGLIDAFPDLGMPAAIDFVTPFLFPEAPAAEAQLPETGTETAALAIAGVTLLTAGGLFVAQSRRHRSSRV